MKSRNHAVICALFLGLAGCAEGDTMEDFWPDPVDRTEVFFRGIHHAMETYWQEFQRFPDDLSELRSALELQAVIDVDAWEQDIRYVPHEDGYCLWSAGPDLEFMTLDDLAVFAEVSDGEIVPRRIGPEEIEARCSI